MRVLYLCLVVAAAMAQGTWQKPGEIQQPKGSWQTPGAIQAPRGIQAIRTMDDHCQRRLIVGADALFDFNKASLSPGSLETLNVLGPLIAKSGNHPVIVEGHTDSVGSAAYNRELSERRAEAVRAWLLERHYAVAASLTVQGFGKTRPVASNTNPDGSDNPAGRQKNRRVEVVINKCQ